MQVIEFSIRGLKKYDLFWSYGKRHYQCEIRKRQFQKGTEKQNYQCEIIKRQFQKETEKAKLQK